MNVIEPSVVRAAELPVTNADETRTQPRASSIFPLAVVLSLMLALLPHSVRGQEGAGPDALSADAQKILSSLNARRGEAGLSSLQHSALLSQAAQTHANDIFYNGNYSHYGTDGTLAKDRVARTGYAANPWVSENWVSSIGPDAAMTWWMNDYVHRVNILTPRWREVGIGIAGSSGSRRTIYVTVFSPGSSAIDGEEPMVDASAARSASAAQPSGASPPPFAIPEEHVVRPGETLLAIGIRYGIDYVEIASANGLASEALLQIGQTLRMPGADTEYSAGIGGPVDTAIETRPYEIRTGETLFSIAAANGMSWQDLAGLNGLAENSLLQIGQTIQVPAVDDEPASEDAADGRPTEPPFLADPAFGVPVSLPVNDAGPINDTGPQYHVVVPGDTVIAIADRYDLGWGELLALNGLDDDSLLRPGDLLRIE